VAVFPERDTNLRIAAARGLGLVALGLLLILHDDFWLAADGSLLLGLPAGLTYHVAFCFACAAVMWLLVRFAWPADLEVEGEAGDER